MLENDIKKKSSFHTMKLQKLLKKLGAQLTKDYAGKNPILVGILKRIYSFYGWIGQTYRYTYWNGLYDGF